MAQYIRTTAVLLLLLGAAFRRLPALDGADTADAAASKELATLTAFLGRSGPGSPSGHLFRVFCYVSVRREP